MTQLKKPDEIRILIGYLDRNRPYIPVMPYENG